MCIYAIRFMTAQKRTSFITITSTPYFHMTIIFIHVTFSNLVVQEVLFNLPSAAWSDEALVSIQKMNLHSNASVSVSEGDRTVTSIKSLLTALSKDGVESADLLTEILKQLIENTNTVSVS